MPLERGGKIGFGPAKDAKIDRRIVACSFRIIGVFRGSFLFNVGTRPALASPFFFLKGRGLR
jgi:hypothetical protein